MTYMDTASMDLHYEQDAVVAYESRCSHDCLGRDSCLEMEHPGQEYDFARGDEDREVLVYFLKGEEASLRGVVTVVG